jgi:hypothetical protein
MAHGKIEPDYSDEEVALSSYQLSGACAASRLAHALERHWGIV